MASQNLLPESMMTEDILKLTARNGCSVAYHVAGRKSFPKWAKKRKDILLLGNGKGNYVAHVLAKLGRLPVEMMTEEILKLQTRKGCSVAYYAAVWNSLPEWATRRKDILLLRNGKGDYVAHALAMNGGLPKEMMTEDILKLKNRDEYFVAYHAAWQKVFPEWAKKRKDILLLGDGQGNYVAHVLAKLRQLPVEMMTEDILSLTDSVGCSIAYYIAGQNCLPEWLKRHKNILMLGNGRGDYVVHVLARLGKLPKENMTPDILQKTNSNGQSVLFKLVSEQCLSPEILMLPWDEKTKVFEYLLSEEFQQQAISKQDMIYVKEQIKRLFQKQSLLELSVVCSTYDDMER